MRRTLSITAIVLDLLMLATAGIVRWVIAPARAVLPSDMNTTRGYAGTAAVLLNPAALTGAGGSVLLKNVPITVTHTTKTLKTSGNNALVSDAKTVVAGQSPVAAVDYQYSVNRTNLGRGSHFTGVLAQQGLTFNWPVRTNKQNYTGWVSDTNSTTTLKYTGTAKRGGVSTYVYTTTTTPAAITDPQVLRTLPASLPKAQLVGLAGGLGLPSAELAQLQTVLPTLPDPVPFSYTYQVTATYWVAPNSGIVVDLNQHEVRTLNLVIGGATVAVTPVMDITFSSTPSTLAAAAQDARSKGTAITRIYSTIPLGSSIGGGVLLLLGVFGFAIRRRPEASPLTGAHEEIQPIGTSS